MIMSGLTKVEMSSSLIDCRLSQGGPDGRRGQGHDEREGVTAAACCPSSDGGAHHPGAGGDAVWGGGPACGSPPPAGGGGGGAGGGGYGGGGGPGPRGLRGRQKGKTPRRCGRR